MLDFWLVRSGSRLLKPRKRLPVQSPRRARESIAGHAELFPPSLLPGASWEMSSSLRASWEPWSSFLSSPLRAPLPSAQIHPRRQFILPLHPSMISCPSSGPRIHGMLGCVASQSYGSGAPFPLLPVGRRTGTVLAGSCSSLGPRDAESRTFTQGNKNYNSQGRPVAAGGSGAVDINMAVVSQTKTVSLMWLRQGGFSGELGEIGPPSPFSSSCAGLNPSPDPSRRAPRRKTPLPLPLSPPPYLRPQPFVPGRWGGDCAEAENSASILRWVEWFGSLKSLSLSPSFSSLFLGGGVGGSKWVDWMAVLFSDPTER